MSKPEKDGKQKTTKKEGEGKDKKIRSSNKPPSISKVKVQLPFIREEEVELKDKLGEGAYGEVFKGICRQSVVAVKYIKEEKCDPDALLAELTIMFQVCFYIFKLSPQYAFFDYPPSSPLFHFY